MGLYRLSCCAGLLHVILLALQLGVHGVDGIFIHQFGIQRESLHHLHVQLGQLRVLPAHVHQQISKRRRCASSLRRHLPVNVLQLLVNERAHLIAGPWWGQNHNMMQSQKQIQEELMGGG